MNDPDHPDRPMSLQDMPLRASDVLAARERLHGWVRHTPLLSSPWLSRLAGRPVLLKAENLQVTGSFKARGAVNCLLQLPPAERTRGVVTASAGNQGQAVAWAAAQLGIKATIVLPIDAVPVKAERTRAWGAAVVQAGRGYDEAHRHAEALAQQTDALYIPFEHADLIAGHGTVALEIFQEQPDVEVLIVPVGGGALVGGVGVAATARSPRPRVLGVQSDRTRAMHAALRAGHLVPVDTPPTLADGLAGQTSQTMLDLCRALDIAVVLVPEETLLYAIGETLGREHLAIEGSAAVTVAAVLGGLLPPGNAPVALILSGGNVDPGVLIQALTATSDPPAAN
jgi:threonine dehydratase